MSDQPSKYTEPNVNKRPGTCIPWEEQVKRMPPIEAKPELVRKVWEDVDGLGYMYIWHLLVSS